MPGFTEEATARRYTAAAKFARDGWGPEGIAAFRAIAAGERRRNAPLTPAGTMQSLSNAQGHKVEISVFGGTSNTLFNRHLATAAKLCEVLTADAKSAGKVADIVACFMHNGGIYIRTELTKATLANAGPLAQLCPLLQAFIRTMQMAELTSGKMTLLQPGAPVVLLVYPDGGLEDDRKAGPALIGFHGDSPNKKDTGQKGDTSCDVLIISETTAKLAPGEKRARTC